MTRTFVAFLVVGLCGCFEAPCEVASEPGRPPIPCLAPMLGVDAGVRVDAGPGADAGRRDAGGVDAGFDAGVVLPTMDAGVRIVDLGLVVTDGGSARELSFDVGPNDEGFQIELVSRGSALVALQVDALRSPSGTMLALGPDYRLHLSRSRANVGAQAALVLESDDARREFVPGRWTFRVTASDENAQPLGALVSVRVFIKPRPPAGARQRLALNLFFSGSAGLTAQTAPTQPRLQQALSVFRQRYLDAGIELATPTLLTLPPGFSSVTGYFLEADAGPGVGRSAQELLRQSASAPPGMNIFFVEALELDPRLPPGAILGVAGGVPGMTMTHGTSGSGVIVLFDAATYVPRRPGDVDTLGNTLAHEVGHQLGLSHVFELLGDEDNLSDTAGQSEPRADENLMAPYSGDKGAITPLQATTLRRNPVVRP